MTIFRALFEDSDMKGRSAEAFFRNGLRAVLMRRLNSLRYPPLPLPPVTPEWQACISADLVPTGHQTAGSSKQLDLAPDVSPERACSMIAGYANGLRHLDKDQQQDGMRILGLPLESKKELARRLLGTDL